MGGPVIMSALFHGVAFALLYLGLPHLKHDELSSERVIVVELLAVDERRNLPEHSSVLDARKELREEDRAPAIAPPPPPPAAPPPSPSNSIRTVSTPPPPKPTPHQLEEEAQKQVEDVGLPDNVKVPVKKPNPPSKLDPFASVLKSVEELEVSGMERSDSDPEPEEAKPDLPIKDSFEQVLARADSEFRPDVPLSMTELDNIRYQIEKNWHLPAGGRNVHNMQVTLRLQLAPDGTVLDVSVVDQVQMKTDPFYRAMAESTVRAVLKTGQIKNLSPEKYHLWRDMRINFDPKEMFG